MDPLELQYDNMSAVPEAFRPLYTEKEGKVVLTGVNGIKTQAEIDTVMEALRKERNDHGKTREALKPFAGLNATEVQEKLSRFSELEAAAAGKIDDKKIEEIVNGRLAQKTGPLQLQIENLTKTLAEKDGVISTLNGTITGRKRDDIVRDAANKMKIRPEAIPDVEAAVERMMGFDELGKLVTKADVNGILPGLGIDDFLKAMSKSRPHWWPESEGGGSRGGNGGGAGGKNPWSKEHWSLTEQGRVINSEGAEAAERMAKMAGSYVGATAPKA